MKSRAEIVDEAIEIAGEDADVLWALAINSMPMRRAYFETISERTPRQVVKCLARLANVGLLAATDGLLFSIDSERVSQLIVERIPEGRGIELASQSLEFGNTCDDLPEMFFVDHALRSDRPTQAAERLVAQLPEHPAEDSPVAREVIDALNRVLKALWADHVTDALFLSVGKALIQHGPTSIKPRAWRELLAALEAHPEADDALRAALAQADNQFKKRRAAERRVAAESLSEVVAPVESEGD